MSSRRALVFERPAPYGHGNPNPSNGYRFVASGLLATLATWRGKRRQLARLLVTLALLAPLGGCDDLPRFSYWVTNDSDSDVLVDVRALPHRTWSVPAHSYGALVTLDLPIQSGWSVRIVDGGCNPIQSLPIDPAYDLVYVDPSGRAEVTKGAPWAYGLGTARQATLEPIDACP